MINYWSANQVVEASKVEIDLKDEEWITIRVNQGHRTPLTIHVCPADGKKLELFKGKLEYGDSYILMEEVNASDTTESAKAS